MSILLLSVAIIPMVGMFDAGLRAAVSGSNYDQARAFANEQLENAKTRPYDTPPPANADDLKNDFPVASSEPVTGTGKYTSPTPNPPVPADVGLPQGSSYSIEKQYLAQPPANAVSGNFTTSATDQKFMRVTVTVAWNSSSFKTSGVVAE